MRVRVRVRVHVCVRAGVRACVSVFVVNAWKYISCSRIAQSLTTTTLMAFRLSIHPHHPLSYRHSHTRRYHFLSPPLYKHP